MKKNHKQHELFSVHCNGSEEWFFKVSCTQKQLLQIAEAIINKIKETTPVKVSFVTKEKTND